jgi:hypothetical protein
MAWQDRIAEIAANPMVFAAGVGVANGVLAVVRDKEFTPNAAYITAGVIAAGEVALILDLPESERPNLTKFFFQSALGTLIGISPFVSWTPGSRSLLQWAGESLAEKAPVPEAA